MSEIKSSDEMWDDRQLGADEEHVKVVDAETEEVIDKAACTQAISIRMQKSLIEDLKLIAAYNKGIGYQTLMKQILQRFVEGEKKIIFRELVSQKLAERDEPDKPTKKLKRA